jgi:hypothetical protein
MNIFRVVGHAIPRPERMGLGHSDPQVQLEKVAEAKKQFETNKDIPEKV